MARDDDRAERHHFKIGEVAELLGVRPHVLRYWEQEFPALRPKKTRGAHRHYSRANVATAQAIRDLIVEQGYSIAGAKIQIAANASGESTGPAMTPDAIGAEVERSAERRGLESLRSELVSLLNFVDTQSTTGSDPYERDDENDLGLDLEELVIASRSRATDS